MRVLSCPLVRRTLISAVAGLFIFAASAWAPPTDTNPVLESFDAFNDGDVLLLPIELDGQRYQFVLDTGASTSMYDASLSGLANHGGSMFHYNGEIRNSPDQPEQSNLGAESRTCPNTIPGSRKR